MLNIEIYSSPLCGYCSQAKKLLHEKKVEFVEINILLSPAMREEMNLRSNGRNTVPQIFINDVHIGGYDELHAIDRAGKLEQLLAQDSLVQ